MDPLSKEDDEVKLSHTSSVQLLARPVHRAPRFSPYQLPNGAVHQFPISETRADISCNNFAAIPRETTGAVQDKNGAFWCQEKWDN
ncbi:unnamed protein product [Rotaria sp. Silwood1]|nr:unnamed protein product [Rotaria sp. Silwood1]